MNHCCPAGEGSGIYFPGSEVRTCRRHFTPEQAALIHELDRRGVAVGLTKSADGVTWPYGPNIDVTSRQAMVTWAEQHGLRRVTSYQRLQCVCWPTSNRRSVCECGRGRSFSPPDHIWDHVTHWKTREGARAVVVLQPYDWTESGREILNEWASRDDVRIEVREDSWYGHGTKFIGIWNAQFAPPSQPRGDALPTTADRPGRGGWASVEAPDCAPTTNTTDLTTHTRTDGPLPWPTLTRSCIAGLRPSSTPLNSVGTST